MGRIACHNHDLDFDRLGLLCFPNDDCGPIARTGNALKIGPKRLRHQATFAGLTLFGDLARNLVQIAASSGKNAKSDSTIFRGSYRAIGALGILADALDFSRVESDNSEARERSETCFCGAKTEFNRSQGSAHREEILSGSPSEPQRQQRLPTRASADVDGRN